MRAWHLIPFGGRAALARLLGSASRRSGRGGGTTLPGRALLRMAPDALDRLGSRLTGPVTAISATNGKTTTASLLDAILTADGRRTVHNSAGSNMAWGVATALLEGSGSDGVFEVDEAWLPEVSSQIQPDLYLLCNLFRDQLDRHGELETLAELWRVMLDQRTGGGQAGVEAGERPQAPGTLARDPAPQPPRSSPPAVVLNADDPLVADLALDAQGNQRPGVCFFGVDDPNAAAEGESMSHDAKHCRRCGTLYHYEIALLGHLGHYSCPGCGASRPRPHVAARSVALDGMRGSRLELSTPDGDVAVDLPLPGLYNAYNALAAIAAAISLGVPPADAAQAMGASRPVFGRVEQIDVGPTELAILLIKNPAGATEVIRTVASTAGPEEPADLWIALNDRTADGHDISWIWDADLERMADRVRHVTCAGTRAEELALRLVYAGWPRSAVTVRRPIAESLDEALARSGPRLFALPTYTALLELQALLARRGLISGYLQ